MLTPITKIPFDDLPTGAVSEYCVDGIHYNVGIGMTLDSCVIRSASWMSGRLAEVPVRLCGF